MKRASSVPDLRRVTIRVVDSILSMHLAATEGLRVHQQHRSPPGARQFIATAARPPTSAPLQELAGSVHANAASISFFYPPCRASSIAGLRHESLRGCNLFFRWRSSNARRRRQRSLRLREGVYENGCKGFQFPYTSKGTKSEGEWKSETSATSDTFPSPEFQWKRLIKR